MRTRIEEAIISATHACAYACDSHNPEAAARFADIAARLADIALTLSKTVVTVNEVENQNGTKEINTKESHVR